MQSEIDSFKVEGEPRVRSECLWLESQGVIRLEKRMEMDVEVEKMVITSPKYWEYVKLLKAFTYWKSKQNETL